MRSYTRVPAHAALLLGSLLAAACGGSTEPTVNAPTIHLSASQASVLTTRMKAIAPVHPELAWLADSASLVLASGAEADRIDVTTDLASGPFYAVGLQRSVVTSSNSFATFDLIAFDDPSNPTNFMIVDGYGPGSGTTPPTSVAGPFGGSVMNGHLFHVEGSTVTAWRAQSGGGTFSTGTTGGACTGFQAQNGVTCEAAALQTSFQMTAAPDGGSAGDTKHATLGATSVAGILLRFQ